MFDLSKVFKKDAKDIRLSNDEIAELLRTSKEALDRFEATYKEASKDFNVNSYNLFDYSVEDAKNYLTKNVSDDANETVNRVVDELVEDTFSGVENKLPRLTNDDLKSIPLEIRPQLTGDLYQVQVDPDSSQAVLAMYSSYLKETNPEKKRHFYYMFRQGLDILDLDPILYAMLSNNPTSMGYWFQTLKEAVDSQSFFKVPKTKIIRVPLPILQMSRLDYETLTPATIKIIDDYCMRVFDLDVNKKYFVKTGTYSSKFNFRNAKVEGEKEVRELGEYLLFLSHQAVEMAGPLTQPSIYGVSTTNEWVVREYIDDVENNPCIYNGMPLHTEYRFFVDFDTDEILGVSPYWRPDVMLKRFSQDANPYSPHDKHDYVIYKMHEPVLMKRYTDNVNIVFEHMSKLIKDIELSGQWSIDVMQNGNDFYIIDMATACTSALSDCVPKGLIKKYEERWLPEIKTS